MKEKIKKLFNYFLIGIFAVIPLALIIKILFFVKDLLVDMVSFVSGYAGNNTFYTSLFLTLSCVVLISIGHKLVAEGRVWFLALIDAAIEKIPFLNTIYRVLKKVINMFAQDQTVAKEVVYVEYPKEGIWVPAYVTNRFDNKYVLFIPTSPNPTSGFTVIVDKNKVVKSSMNIEEATSFIVSVGVDYNKVSELNQLP